MAASVWMSAPNALLSAGQKSPQSPDNEALWREAQRRMTLMLAGIKKYQAHPYERPECTAPVIWKAGTVTVRDFSHGIKAGKKRPAVLVVPSMINGSSILDLVPERSFVRWLAGRGHHVCLLDWGRICDDPDMQDLDGAIRERLVQTVQNVAAIHDGPVHVAGYCMGGTLALAAASFAPEFVRSLVLLATPWDFHADGAALSNRVRFWAPAAMARMESRGTLSSDSIQTLFASLDPLMVARKFSRFAEMAEDDPDAALFVATEDWLNDGVDLPRGIARTCIQEWYLENRTGKGTWKIGPDIIAPKGIGIPSLVVASRRDRLVPYGAASALASLMPRAELVEPDCGHIGMMAGARAVSEVWSPVSDWFGRIS